MHQKLRAALLGALLAVPFGALAQQSPRLPDPADPAALVAPIVYESAFAPVFARPAPEPQGSVPTPDKLWRAANEAVAAPSGHAGHGAHGAHPAGSAASRPAPAASVPAPARQPAPVDHSKHHQAEADK